MAKLLYYNRNSSRAFSNDITFKTILAIQGVLKLTFVPGNHSFSVQLSAVS